MSLQTTTSRILSACKYIGIYVAIVQTADGDVVPGETKRQKVIEMVQKAAKVSETLPNELVEVVGTAVDLACEVVLGKMRQTNTTPAATAPAPLSSPSLV